MKQIVRIINVDIPGEKSTYAALRHIKGVSYSFSNAICSILNLNKSKKIGELTEAEVKKVEEVVKNPLKYKIPPYMLNRRKDFDTGEDTHLVAAKLHLQKEFDIKRLKRIKCYKGMRHSFGLPVRGQKTKGHFRKGKSVGVTKKAKMSRKK